MFAKLAKAWKQLPEWSEKGSKRSLQDFLPPSLEVLEKPPHPAPRILLWVTVAIFVSVVIWAVAGKVDIITSAVGRVIPCGLVMVIQPLERSVVRRILVRDGQMIAAGEPLVELDQNQILAERARIDADLGYTVHRLARRVVLAEWLEQEKDFSITLPAVERLLAERDLDVDPRLLYEEWCSIIADIATLDSQLEERKAELAAARIVVRQYDVTIPLLETRAQAVRYLYEKNVVSKMEFLSVEEERQRQLHTQQAEGEHAKQLAAAVISVERQIEGQRTKNLADVLSQIDDLTRQKNSLMQEQVKLNDMSAKTVLSSPVDGTVKGLAISTVGGVVNEAEILMEVVPADDKLEVEAFIGNQDIGFVQEGQIAEVKIHTFPFTRYGIIKALVTSVASDATLDEKQGLIYKTRLVLDRNDLLVDGKVTPLIPGMSVTAEISTGQRRLVEFFLAPLLRAGNESFRER